jgi:hypothetical protein
MENKIVTIEEEKEVLIVETSIVDEWDNHIGDLVMF